MRIDSTVRLVEHAGRVETHPLVVSTRLSSESDLGPHDIAWSMHRLFSLVSDERLRTTWSREQHRELIAADLLELSKPFS